ncbi:MAG: DinB/UmuC family translesion DNA polymerase [Rhizomicrobium sp.]
MVSSGSPLVNPRRIIALWFPRLATDRLQRRWKAQGARNPCTGAPREPPPVVVVAKEKNALRLSALDRKATSLGLSIGQPLANARAMLPELKVMVANDGADLKLLEHIADWCDRFTPFVALDPPRALLLDVTGAAHLFGGEKPLLDRILNTLRKQGFVVRGALAGTAMAARACTRHHDGLVVVPGEEMKITAPLPIEALFLDPVTTHAFRRAGLKTIGQVAHRDRRELTARFGSAMVFTLETALGKTERPISPRTPLPDYSAERNFSEPVATEAIIRATLVSLAETLAEALEQRGEGARRLEAAFFRADGAVIRIAVETGSPTREPAVIERLFREKLDALADPLDPGFGFDLIRLSASHVQRCETALADFNADLNAEREIRFLVDRLSARFGAHRVLAFQPNDTHIPEAAGLAVPAQELRGTKSAWQKRRRNEAPRRPLRLLAKPEEIEAISRIPASPPRRFRWRRVMHDIVLAEGPERIAMEWWRRAAPQMTRDYFRVEDTEGNRFWLYRDGLYTRETGNPRWYLHGVFA